MTFSKATEQIRILLESSTCCSEWNDTLENYFPEAYWVNDIQIYPDNAYIRVDWSSMTFTFTKVELDFYLQMWSHTESGKQEHGTCLASGEGKFVYSSGNIVEINDLEIVLSSQHIVEPKYNHYYISHCINIKAVVTSLKSVYPYPNNKMLANWARVTENTIIRWHKPRVRARKDYVDQLMSSFFEYANVANILSEVRKY